MGLEEAIFLAIIAGIIPGLHINTVSLIAKGSEYIPLMLGIYFPLTTIPLVLLSLAEGNNISNLFIIKKIKEGRLQGKVLFLAPISSLAGVFIALFLYLLAPSLIIELSKLIENNVYGLVFLLSLLVILKSKKRKEFLAIFLISGMIGIFSFEELKVEKFLPMFAGFFSLNALRRFKKARVIEQRINIRKFIFPLIVGSMLGFIAVLLPGVSSPSMLIAVISFSSLKPLEYTAMSYSFLASQGFYSLIGKEAIGKSRIGAISYTNSTDYFLYSIGLILGVLISKAIFSIIGRITPHINEKIIAFFLLCLIAYFEGTIGLAIAFLSYALGSIREEMEVGGNAHLGSIIVPLLLRFF